MNIRRAVYILVAILFVIGTLVGLFSLALRSTNTITIGAVVTPTIATVIATEDKPTVTPTLSVVLVGGTKVFASRTSTRTPNPTQFQATLDVLIAQQFATRQAATVQVIALATANQQAGGTATALKRVTTATTVPAPANQTATLAALVSQQLLTAQAVTSTAVLQTSVAALLNNYLTATAQANMITLTPTASLDPIAADSTLQAVIKEQLATFQAATATGAAQVALATLVGESLSGTQGARTAIPTPSLDSIAADRTLQAVIKEQLATLQAATATGAAQVVLATLVGESLSGTQGARTATPASTAPATADINAAVNARLVQTAQVLQTQTAVVRLESTLQAEVNRFSTATAVAFYATLSKGLQPITVGNVSKTALLTSLTGHSAGISDLVYGTNGLLFASASADGTLRVWDVQNSRSVLVLQNYIANTAVAFSPNNRFIASGGNENVVRLWDIYATQPDKLTNVLRGHFGTITAVAFSPDGKWLASASNDRTVRIWNMFDINAAPVVLVHQTPVTSLAFAPDSKRLVTGSVEGALRLWEVTGGSGLGLPIRAHTGSVTKVAFSPDGASFGSGGVDGFARLWDAKTSSQINSWKAPLGSVSTVTFSLDGKLLIVSSNDTKTSSISIWEIQSSIATALASFDIPAGLINGLAINPRNTGFILGLNTGEIQVWGVRQ